MLATCRIQGSGSRSSSSLTHLGNAQTFIMATMESPAPDSSKKKASLFRRTVPRKKPTQQSSPEVANNEQSGEETNDLEFFSRSKEVFPMALKEVLEQQKPPSPEKHDRKRRRVSMEEATVTAHKRDSSPIVSHASERRKSSSFIGLASDSDTDSDLIMDVKGKGKEIVKSPKLPRPKKSVLGAKKASPGIALLEDENDELQLLPSRKAQNDRAEGGSPPVVGEQNCKAGSIAEDSSDLEEIEPPDEEDPVDEELSAFVAKAQQQQAASNPDAVVLLFIDSRIPGTVPLVVKRKLKGTFIVALETWVMHQRTNANFSISEEEAARLLLTWKGHKIYGHSTPASLGIQANDHGHAKGSGEGIKKGAVHVEVWTEEQYADYLGKKRASKMGLIDSDDDFDTKLENPSPLPPPKKGIRVVLKAKTLESLNTTVYDDTTVAIIIQVFRKQRDIGPERRVEIWFDGERLDEDSLVTDADIDPDETNQLEVHVK